MLGWKRAESEMNYQVELIAADHTDSPPLWEQDAHSVPDAVAAARQHIECSSRPADAEQIDGEMSGRFISALAEHPGSPYSESVFDQNGVVVAELTITPEGT